MDAFSLRPQAGNEEAFFAIKDWCDVQGCSVSAVFNALLAPIANSLENCQVDTPGLVVVMDFGEIRIQ
jgi:hypothetical protein